jgi:hypothetical protein
MVFPEVDARSEARICMTFRVPPMLIGAKIGLDRSTFTNYAEARKGFYEGPIFSEWGFLSSVIKDQLLPDFEITKTFVCKFDKREVAALQEDRTAKWNRAIEAARQNLTTRDESREEMGLDPIDNEDVFVGPSQGMSKDTEEAIENLITNPDKSKDNPNVPKFGSFNNSQEQMDLEDAEEKKYKTFAKKRIKEGKFGDLREYEFKYLSTERQKELIKEFEAVSIIASLKESIGV